jgi:hypothetical protein
MLLAAKTYYRYLGLLLLLVGCRDALSAQSVDTVYRQVYHLPGPFRHLEVDPLGNAYVLTPDGDLLQVLPDGRVVFNYHNTVLGEPTQLDLSDPFNLVLFFAEQQTIVLLDRTLSERSQLDLRTTDIQNASAVARSHDNQLWVYDDYAGRLYKLNERGQVLLASDDLRLAENLTGGADRMLRFQDRMLLHFPERGLSTFTFYGRLDEWWPVIGVNDWQPIGVRLLVQKDSSYQYYFPRVGKWEEIKDLAATEAYTRLRLLPGRRYYLRRDGSLLLQEASK